MTTPSITIDRSRVGVLGGTFDPVHHGHLEAALAVLRLTGLARVLFVPAASPPHKPAGAEATARHRAAMVRLAIAGSARLVLSMVELRTRRVCYSIDTLRRLRDGRQRLAPLFILGSDSLLELPTWHAWEALLGEFDLLVVGRGACGRAWRRRLHPTIQRALVSWPDGPRARAAWRALDPGAGGRVFVLPVHPPDVSSSSIRAKVAAGKRLAGLVPPAVARYIHEQGLYRSEGRS